MKNFTLNIILMVILALPCTAQEKGESEIAVSYAAMTSENPLSTLWLGLSNFRSLGDRDFTLRQGAMFASYKYFVSDRIAVGATTGFNRNVHGSIFWLRDFSRSDARTLTMAGEVTWYFIRKPAVKLYSMGGLGFYALRSSIDNYSTSTLTYGPTTQLTAIGARFGKKSSVFTELGFGYKGIINTGLSIKF